MNISADQIQKNWQLLMRVIDKYIADNGPSNQFPDRKKHLLKMYDELQDRMIFAPASSQEDFHNAFPGGYVAHILNIVSFAIKIYGVWKGAGAIIDDYTEEELVFAALHHDLGKSGDGIEDHYIPNPSDWHRKNQGKIYTSNPDLQFMSPPDRGLWILNQYNVKMTINETLGIKLADGLYDDGNVQYLKTFSINNRLKSNLPFIIHQADMAATRVEYESWIKSKQNGAISATSSKIGLTKQDETKKVTKLKDEFNELFKAG
jgi:hypothetical protein